MSLVGFRKEKTQKKKGREKRKRKEGSKEELGKNLIKSLLFWYVFRLCMMCLEVLN